MQLYIKDSYHTVYIPGKGDLYIFQQEGGNGYIQGCDYGKEIRNRKDYSKIW